MVASDLYIAASIWFETTQTNWTERFLVNVRRLVGALLSLPMMMMISTLGGRNKLSASA